MIYKVVVINIFNLLPTMFLYQDLLYRTSTDDQLLQYG